MLPGAQEGPAQQERGLKGGQEPEGVRSGCRFNEAWKPHQATAWRKHVPVMLDLSAHQTPRGHGTRRLAPPQALPFSGSGAAQEFTS